MSEASANDTKTENASNLPFPRKLHAMLEVECAKDRTGSRASSDGVVLEWDESGHAFRILNEQLFQEKVLPKYFRTARITSFIRNLNIYGFRKGAAPFESETSNDAKHAGWYVHPDFKRSDVEAISKMSRTIGRLPSGSQDARKKAKERAKGTDSETKTEGRSHVEGGGHRSHARQREGSDTHSNFDRVEGTGRPTPPRSRSVSLPDSVSLSPEFSPFSTKIENGLCLSSSAQTLQGAMNTGVPAKGLMENRGLKSGLQILSTVAGFQGSGAFGNDILTKRDEQVSTSKDTTNPAKSKKNMRVGRWNPEEEEYSQQIIREFKAGTLPLKEGTMLRIFLSVLLNCDPMRISKKFRLEGSVGKQQFTRNWESVRSFQEWEKERKRKEFVSLEEKFFRACQLSSKHELCVMPSPMPWSDWLTKNEKEAMIDGGRIHLVSRDVRSTSSAGNDEKSAKPGDKKFEFSSLAIKGRPISEAPLSVCIEKQLKIQSKTTNVGSGRYRFFNRRRSFDEFLHGMVPLQHLQPVMNQGEKLTASNTIPDSTSKRHRITHGGIISGAVLANTRKDREINVENTDENIKVEGGGANLKDAFASISSATVSSAKTAGIHATPEEWAALQNIICKIKTRNNSGGSLPLQSAFSSPRPD